MGEWQVLKALETQNYSNDHRFVQDLLIVFCLPQGKLSHKLLRRSGTA